MPNWTSNSVTIEGDAADLKQIADANFAFQKLHPCPFIDGEECQEGWYDWCCKYWGTKWSANEVDLSYEEGESTLLVNFQTPWCTPDAFLTYLTKIYPSLKIENEWQDENNEEIGICTYSNGEFNCSKIQPRDYTLDALKTFSEMYTWFSYEDYVEQSDQDEDMQQNEEAEVKLEEVVVKYIHATYEEMIA